MLGLISVAAGSAVRGSVVNEYFNSAGVRTANFSVTLDHTSCLRPGGENFSFSVLVRTDRARAGLGGNAVSRELIQDSVPLVAECLPPVESWYVCGAESVPERQMVMTQLTGQADAEPSWVGSEQFPNNEGDPTLLPGLVPNSELFGFEWYRLVNNGSTGPLNVSASLAGRRRMAQLDPNVVSQLNVYGSNEYMNIERVGPDFTAWSTLALKGNVWVAGGYTPPENHCARVGRIFTEKAKFVELSLLNLGAKNREPRSFGAFDYQLTGLWAGEKPYDFRATCAAEQSRVWALTQAARGGMHADMPPLRGRPRGIVGDGAPGGYTEADLVIPMNAPASPQIYQRYQEANGQAPTIVYSLRPELGTAREILLGLINNTLDQLFISGESGADGVRSLRERVIAGQSAPELYGIATTVGLETFVNQYLLQKRTKNSLDRQGLIDAWQMQCPCSELPGAGYGAHGAACAAQGVRGRMSDSRCDFTPAVRSGVGDFRYTVGDGATCQPRFVARDPVLSDLWETVECRQVSTPEKLCDLARFRGGCGYGAPHALYDSLTAMFDKTGENVGPPFVDLAGLADDAARDAAVLQAMCPGGRPRNDLWFETGGEPGDGEWDAGKECPCSESSTQVFQTCPTNPWERLDFSTGQYRSTGHVQKGRLERGGCVCMPVFEVNVLAREVALDEQLENRCDSPALFTDDKYNDRDVFAPVLDAVSSVGGICCLGAGGAEGRICDVDQATRATIILTALTLDMFSDVEAGFECCIGEGCHLEANPQFFSIQPLSTDGGVTLKNRRLDEVLLQGVSRVVAKHQYGRTDQERCIAEYVRLSGNWATRQAVFEQGIYTLALSDNTENTLNFLNQKLIPASQTRANVLRSLLAATDSQSQVSDIQNRVASLGMTQAEGDLDDLRAALERSTAFVDNLDASINSTYSAFSTIIAEIEENYFTFAVSSAAERNATRSLIAQLEGQTQRASDLQQQIAAAIGGLQRDGVLALGDQARRVRNIPKARQHIMNTMELLLRTYQTRGMRPWASSLPGEERDVARVGVYPVALSTAERRIPVASTRVWFVAQGEDESQFETPDSGPWLHQASFELLCESEFFAAGMQAPQAIPLLLPQIFGPPECLLGSTRPGRGCFRGCRLRAFHRACRPGMSVRAGSVRAMEQNLAALTSGMLLAQDMQDLQPYGVCSPGTIRTGLAARPGPVSRILSGAANSLRRTLEFASDMAEVLAGVRGPEQPPAPLPSLRNYTPWAQRAGDFLVEEPEPGLDTASHEIASGLVNGLCNRGLASWADALNSSGAAAPAGNPERTTTGNVFSDFAFENVTSKLLIVDQPGYDALVANFSTVPTRGFVEAALAVVQEAVDDTGRAPGAFPGLDAGLPGFAQRILRSNLCRQSSFEMAEFVNAFSNFLLPLLQEAQTLLASTRGLGAADESRGPTAPLPGRLGVLYVMDNLWSRNINDAAVSPLVTQLGFVTRGMMPTIGVDTRVVDQAAPPPPRSQERRDGRQGEASDRTRQYTRDRLNDETPAQTAHRDRHVQDIADSSDFRATSGQSGAYTGAGGVEFNAISRNYVSTAAAVGRDRAPLLTWCRREDSGAVRVRVTLDVAALARQWNSTPGAAEYALFAGNNSCDGLLAEAQCQRIRDYARRLSAETYSQTSVQPATLVPGANVMFTLGHLHCASGEGCLEPRVWDSRNGSSQFRNLYTYDLSASRVSTNFFPTHKPNAVNTISAPLDKQVWLERENNRSKAEMFSFEEWYVQFRSLSADSPLPREQIYDPRHAAFDAESIRVPVRPTVWRNPQNGLFYATYQCAVVDAKLGDWCAALRDRRVVLRGENLQGCPTAPEVFDALQSASWVDPDSGDLQFELWTGGVVTSTIQLPEFDLAQTLFLNSPCPTDFRLLYETTPFVSVRFSDATRAPDETAVLRFSTRWSCFARDAPQVELLRNTSQYLVLDPEFAARETSPQSGAVLEDNVVTCRLYPPVAGTGAGADPLVCQTLEIRADRVTPNLTIAEDGGDAQPAIPCWQSLGAARVEASVQGASEFIISHKSFVQTIAADLFNLTLPWLKVQEILAQEFPNTLVGHPYLNQEVDAALVPRFTLDTPATPRPGALANLTLPIQPVLDVGLDAVEKWALANRTLPENATDSEPVVNLLNSLVVPALLNSSRNGTDPVLFDLTLRNEVDNILLELDAFIAFNATAQQQLLNDTAQLEATNQSLNQILELTLDRLIEGFSSAQQWGCFEDLIMELDRDPNGTLLLEKVYTPINEAATAVDRLRRNRKAAVRAGWMFVVTILPLLIGVPLLTYWIFGDRYQTGRAVRNLLQKRKDPAKKRLLRNYR